MIDGRTFTPAEIAGLVARALPLDTLPEGGRHLGTAIREQLLLEALLDAPAPRTLDDLARAVQRRCMRAGAECVRLWVALSAARWGPPSLDLQELAHRLLARETAHEGGQSPRPPAVPNRGRDSTS